LNDGLRSLGARPELVVTTERLSPAMAAGRLGAGGEAGFLLIDVRTAGERAQKSIAGSLGIPLNHLSAKLPDGPRSRPIVVHCAGGYRSSIAASLLQRAGFSDVAELAGGIAAWETARLPVDM
jgi:rhodanese-related sulfurtransferase